MHSRPDGLPLDTPRLDPRSPSDIVASAEALARRYVSDWKGFDDPRDPGRPILDLFARLMELLVERENRIPAKSMVNFLELVGVEQATGSPAEVPVTFVPAKGSDGAVIPARTRVATTRSETVDAQVFETRGEIFATSARLAAMVYLLPTAEGHAEVPLGELPPSAEWLADTSRAIPVLTPDTTGLETVPHVLYLASEPLFGRGEKVDVKLVFTLAPDDRGLLSHVTWKYFDPEIENWFDIELITDADVEAHEVSLRLPALTKTTVDGEEDFFIAGHLDAANAAAKLPWPTLQGITGTFDASGSSDPVAPDFAFANANTLDLSKPFLPFGERPRYGDAFYLGSRTALGPDVSKVTLDMTILPYTDADLAAIFAGIIEEDSITTKVDWQVLDETGAWKTFKTFEHTITATLEQEKTDQGTNGEDTNPEDTGPEDTGPEDTSPEDTSAEEPKKITIVRSAKIGDDSVDNAPGTFFGPTNVDGEKELGLTLELPSELGLGVIHGEEAYWIRALLKSKEPYGSDGFVIPGVAHEPPTPNEPPVFVGPLHVPPTVETLSLSYTLRRKAIAVDRVITENHCDFVHARRPSVDSSTPFRPFLPVAEHDGGVFGDDPALYLGLDRALPENCFISLFVHLDERAAEPTMPLETGDPRIAWESLAPGGAWRPLDVQDTTADLTTSGTVGFLVPPDAASAALFRQAGELPERFWLRARLEKGRYDRPPRLLGIYLDTVMAENRSTVAGDVLVGSGNGKPGQALELVGSSILDGELWVREPERPSAAELETLRQDLLGTLRLEEPNAELDIDALVDLRGETSRGEPELWVRWHRVPNFLASGPRSRHHTLDRVQGVVGFGDGRRGLVPPIAKDNLVLRGYASGGGEDANHVATPLAVKELLTSLPSVAKVFNVAQATGGSAAWSLADTLRFGPQSIKHRGRAVTAEDYEWMIRERFGQVAKVRCLPTRAPDAAGELVFRPGAVTAIVVPKSSASLPRPSNGLLRAIREALEAKTFGGLVGELHVLGPSFVPVSVAAVVEAVSPREASRVARRVGQALERWLHPLTGGDRGEGWPFGRTVYLSQVIARIAGVEGVDHVASAAFVGLPGKRSIAIGENSLTASGTHDIEVTSHGIA